MSSAPPTREDIIQALLEYDQWLCWRAEEWDGKMTKIPINPASGEFASTTDPDKWTDFETARRRLRGLVAGYATSGHDVVFASGEDPRENEVPVAGQVITSGRRLLRLR